MHIPVLLNEAIKFLDPQPGETIVDGTVNGGGYAAAILEKMGDAGTLLGLDIDPRALTQFSEKIRAGKERGVKVILHNRNFKDLADVLHEENLGKANGVVLDLGFSSDQLTGSGRGFSFQKDEPLLMTYSDAIKPVKEILRELDESELAKVIRELSGERFASRIAKAIKERMEEKPIETSGELAEIVKRAVPRGYERGRIHPATRTFLALRIYANRELENLEHFLSRLPEAVAEGGRAVVVSFQSLEDRLVKMSFRNLFKEGKAISMSKKPITPNAEEAQNNPRARSAKLRAIKVIANNANLKANIANAEK